MRNRVLFVCVTAIVGGLVGWTVAAQQKPDPRQQPGAMITMYAPEQRDLYDGHYVMSANRIYMVGGLKDPVGWDHMDNEAKTVKPVAGTAETVRPRLRAVSCGAGSSETYASTCFVSASRRGGGTSSKRKSLCKIPTIVTWDPSSMPVLPTIDESPRNSCSNNLCESTSAFSSPGAGSRPNAIGGRAISQKSSDTRATRARIAVCVVPIVLSAAA